MCLCLYVYTKDMEVFQRISGRFGRSRLGRQGQVYRMRHVFLQHCHYRDSAPSCLSHCFSVPHFALLKESPLLRPAEESESGATHSTQGSMWESWPPYPCLCVGDHFHKRRKSWEPDRPLSALQFWVRWGKRRGLATKVSVLKHKARYSPTKEQRPCHLYMWEKLRWQLQNFMKSRVTKTVFCKNWFSPPSTRVNSPNL